MKNGVDLLLDVGGTGIRGAACRAGGVPDTVREFPSRAEEDRDALLRHFAGILRCLAGGAPVAGIAMAFPGPFDYRMGIPRMRGLAKYESLYGVSLPEALSDQLAGFDIFPREWYFINDISAYALGAAVSLGLGSRVMCVCLGTGAGSAFLVDGKLCTDPGEGVPENGWIYPLPCRDSIIDDHLSDRGFRALSRKMLGREYSPQELNGAAVPGAGRVWSCFGGIVEEALRPVLGSFRPTDLLLGGGLSLAFERFGDALGTLCRALGVRLWLRPETTEYTLRGLMEYCHSA